MKSARLVLLVSSTLVLALAASALAAGKPPAFKPKTGTYTGTMITSTGTSQITGQVGKEGKKYIVQVLGQTTATCADGGLLPAGVGIPATLKGKSFSATESGRDTTGTGGTATWTVSGQFSSEKAFSGTAKKEITAGPLRPESGACSTGTVRFSLHLKG